MKESLTVAEIHRLNGTPGRTVRFWLRDITPIGRAPGRGAAPQYSLDEVLGHIPEPARAKVKKVLALGTPEQSTAPAPDQNEPARSFGELSGKARRGALAKDGVLAAFRGFQSHGSFTSQREASMAFAIAYNAGEIEVSDDARELEPSITWPTLLRWHRSRKRGGIQGLADGYGNRKGCGIFDSKPHFREAALAQLTHLFDHTTARDILDAIRVKYPEEESPSRSTVRAFLRKWKRDNAALYEALRDPDGFKNRYRVRIAKADDGIERLNQRWEIDGTPADVILADGKRYHVLVVIDVFSRRAMFDVAPSESAHAAIRLTARAIMAWGVNETLHGDNGKGFISDHAQRFLADIDIRYVASPPFSPETKPFVERVIGTMSHELLKKLPGFCGHNVSDRQAIRARQSFSARFGARLRKTFEAKLSAAELQKKLDVWAAHVYGERPHASLAGKSPNQVAAEWRGEKRIISDQHALELLAEHAVVRTIGPQGIKIGGARFVAVELGVHVNRRAMVFPDPAGDMGIVHVFLLHDDGSREPLCKAVNADRLGHQRADMAILARQAQNRFIREQRAEMRRIKARIKPETIVDAHLALAAANAAERDSVAERVIHNTVALAAAETALIPPKIPSSVTAQDIAESEERYARYTRLLKLPHRTVSQQRWMESYEKSSEYVSQREWDRILSENSWERAAL